MKKMKFSVNNCFVILSSTLLLSSTILFCVLKKDRGDIKTIIETQWRDIEKMSSIIEAQRKDMEKMSLIIEAQRNDMEILGGDNKRTRKPQSLEECITIVSGQIIMNCNATFDANVVINGMLEAGGDPSRAHTVFPYSFTVNPFGTGRQGSTGEVGSGVVVNGMLNAGADPSRQGGYAFQVLPSEEGKQSSSGVKVNAMFEAGDDPSRAGSYALRVVPLRVREGGSGVVVNTRFSARGNPSRVEDNYFPWFPFF